MAFPKYFYFRVKPKRHGTAVEIEDASDADVAEVVRCEDCEYWRQNYGLWDNTPYCELTATRTDPGFFCAGGERKGNSDG